MNPIEDIDWERIDSTPGADEPDDDSPELTEEDFAKMRPASEVLPRIMGTELATEMLNRPAPGKQRISCNCPERGSSRFRGFVDIFFAPPIA